MKNQPLLQFEADFYGNYDISKTSITNLECSHHLMSPRLYLC